jgi:carbon storage regulator
MLVLSRKIEESIKIGDNIEIKILDVFATDNSASRGSKAASIGITAPKDITILRKELAETRKQNEEAQKSTHLLTGAELSRILKQKRALNDDEG